MKDQVDRYFELLPILLIALVMVVSEHRQERRGNGPVFSPSQWELPSATGPFSASPRIIFR